MCLLALVKEKMTLVYKPVILTICVGRFRSSLAALNYIVLFDRIAEPLMAIASPHRANSSQLCL